MGGVRWGDKGSIRSQKGKLGKQVFWLSLINPATWDVFLTFHVCRPSRYNESLLPSASKSKGPHHLSASKFLLSPLSVHSTKIAFAREKLSLLNGYIRNSLQGMGAVWVVLNLSSLWPSSHPFASRSAFPSVLSHVAVEILRKRNKGCFFAPSSPRKGHAC